MTVLGFFEKKVLSHERKFRESFMVLWWMRGVNFSLFLFGVVVAIYPSRVESYADSLTVPWSLSIVFGVYAPLAYRTLIRHWAKSIRGSDAPEKGDEPTDVFLATLMNAVVTKAMDTVSALRTLGEREVKGNQLRHMFNPEKQIQRISQGILEYVKKYFEIEHEWQIRIAQIDARSGNANIMFRNPESSNPVPSHCLNHKNSAIKRALKNPNTPLIIPCLGKAVKKDEFRPKPGESADSLAGRSLLLFPVYDPKQARAVLMISIMSPAGITFSHKDKFLLGIIKNFSDRLLIEYTTLLAITYIDITLQKQPQPVLEGV